MSVLTVQIYQVKILFPKAILTDVSNNDQKCLIFSFSLICINVLIVEALLSQCDADMDEAVLYPIISDDEEPNQIQPRITIPKTGGEMYKSTLFSLLNEDLKVSHDKYILLMLTR